MVLKIAFFSDIHSNIEALNAVLADLEKQQIDQLYCLGDLVGYGAHPDKVIATIKARNIPTILGNYDQGVGFNLDDCGCAYQNSEEKELGTKSLEWTKEQVSAKNKAFLKELPQELRIKLGPWQILLVHGSPRRINEYLFQDRPAARLYKTLKNTGADIIICGHTHQPYTRKIEEIILINDGSVGKPKSGSPHAQYLILEYDVSLQIRHQAIEYNWDKAAKDVIEAGLPEKFALQILKG